MDINTPESLEMRIFSLRAKVQTSTCMSLAKSLEPVNTQWIMTVIASKSITFLIVSISRSLVSPDGACVRWMQMQEKWAVTDADFKNQRFIAYTRSQSIQIEYQY